MLYNRPDYAKQTLDRIFLAWDISMFKVVVFIDPDGTSQQEDLASQYPVHDIVKFAKHLEQYAAHKRSLEIIFDIYGADWLCYVEDDMLIGPDGLDFYLAMERYLYDMNNLQSTLIAASLWSNPWARACWSIHRFIATWTHYYSKDAYYQHIRKSYEIAEWDGFKLSHDSSTWYYFIKNNLRTLMSDIPRCRNIGEKNATHSQKGVITCGDHWTGERYKPTRDVVVLDETFPATLSKQINQ